MCWSLRQTWLPACLAAAALVFESSAILSQTLPATQSQTSPATDAGPMATASRNPPNR